MPINDEASGASVDQDPGSAAELTASAAAEVVARNAAIVAQHAADNATYQAVIRPEAYGAVGNGTTDDTTALTAAFAAVTTNSILSLRGTYKLTSAITLSGKSKFRIEGPGGISFAATTTSATGTVSAIQLTGCTDFSVEGVTFDCVTQNQQYNGLNLTNCQRARVKGNRGTNWRWVAIGSYDVVPATSTDLLFAENICEYNRYGMSTNAKRVRIQNNLVAAYWLSSTEASVPWANTSLYWDGILLGSGTTEFEVCNNIIVECGQSGVYWSDVTEGVIGHNTVARCQNWGLDGGATVTQSRLTLVGNVCVDNAQGNFNLVKANGCTVTGNTSTNTGTLYFAAIINKVGIALQHGAVGNTVVGNTVVLPASATASGIFCEATATAATGNLIANNIVTATLPYDMNSTLNTLVHGSALAALGAGMKAGLFYVTPCAQSTTVFAEASMRLAPLVIGRLGTIDAIAISITSAGSAGSVVRMGIYADDGTGLLPGLLLSECTSTADGTSATVQTKTLTTSQKVVPGQIVWLAAVCQGGAGTRPTVRFNQNVSGPNLGDASASAVIDNTLTGAQYTTDTVTGALPGTFAGFHTGNTFRLAARAA